MSWHTPWASVSWFVCGMRRAWPRLWRCVRKARAESRPKLWFGKYSNEIAFIVCATAIEVVVAVILRAREGDAASWDLANVSLLGTGLCALVAWRRNPRRFREPWLGLRLDDALSRNLGIGLVLVAAYFCLALVLPICLGIIAVRPDPTGMLPYEEMLGAVRISLFMSVPVACVLFVNALCGEELAFRGYLFGSIERKAGFGTAVICNALLFMAWHVPYFVLVEGGPACPMVLTARLLWLGVGAVAMCFVFAGTRSLYSVAVFHVIVDLKSHLWLRRYDAAVSSDEGRFFVYDVHKPIAFSVMQLAALTCLLLLSMAIWRRGRRSLAHTGRVESAS